MQRRTFVILSLMLSLCSNAFASETAEVRFAKTALQTVKSLTLVYSFNDIVMDETQDLEKRNIVAQLRNESLEEVVSLNDILLKELENVKQRERKIACSKFLRAIANFLNKLSENEKISKGYLEDAFCDLIYVLNVDISLMGIK